MQGYRSLVGFVNPRLVRIRFQADKIVPTGACLGQKFALGELCRFAGDLSSVLTSLLRDFQSRASLFSRTSASTTPSPSRLVYKRTTQLDPESQNSRGENGSSKSRTASPSRPAVSLSSSSVVRHRSSNSFDTDSSSTHNNHSSESHSSRTHAFCILPNVYR